MCFTYKIKIFYFSLENNIFLSCCKKLTKKSIYFFWVLKSRLVKFVWGVQGWLSPALATLNRTL